jgi:hypothetical protein
MKLKVIQPRPLPGFIFDNKTTNDCIQFFYKSYDSFWLRYLNGNATPKHVRENRKDNQQCTIQINWQHWVHKAPDKDKNKTHTEN